MTNVKLNIPKLNENSLKVEIPDVTKSARYRKGLENVRAVAAKGQALAVDAADFVSRMSKECAGIVADVAAGR